MKFIEQTEESDAKISEQTHVQHDKQTLNQRLTITNPLNPSIHESGLCDVRGHFAAPWGGRRDISGGVMHDNSSCALIRVTLYTI